MLHTPRLPLTSPLRPPRSLYKMASALRTTLFRRGYATAAESVKVGWIVRLFGDSFRSVDMDIQLGGTLDMAVHGKDIVIAREDGDGAAWMRTDRE